jgi:hypothetical protein
LAEAEQNIFALRIRPNLVKALSNFGVLLARTIGQIKPSRNLNKSYALIRNEGAVFNLGTLYTARGDYKRAIPYPNGRRFSSVSLSCENQLTLYCPHS